MVVNPDVRLEDLVHKAHFTDLIIAEDQRPTCLLNAGVFLLRVGEWSLRLLEDVWNEPRFHTKRHYEQSALEKVLRSYGEGLEWQSSQSPKPFHSYISNDRSLRHFPHTCVAPRSWLNTHLADDDPEAKESPGGVERAAFIFHPAGRKGKMKLLEKMLSLRAMPSSQSFPCVWSARSEELAGIEA